MTSSQFFSLCGNWLGGIVREKSGVQNECVVLTPNGNYESAVVLRSDTSRDKWLVGGNVVRSELFA